MINVLNIPT